MKENVLSNPFTRKLSWSFLQLMSPLLWMLQASKSSIYAIVTFLLTVESSTGLGAEATL